MASLLSSEQGMNDIAKALDGALQAIEILINELQWKGGNTPQMQKHAMEVKQLRTDISKLIKD